MSIGNKERFSTFRPASMVSKEESDLRELREQMAVLKRMKQQHQRQFSALALKHEQEKIEMNAQQRKDLEVLTSSFNKEMDKIKAKNRIEIEQFVSTSLPGFTNVLVPFLECTGCKIVSLSMEWGHRMPLRFHGWKGRRTSAYITIELVYV